MGDSVHEIRLLNVWFHPQRHCGRSEARGGR
jgi:hypothetical protein